MDWFLYNNGLRHERVNVDYSFSKGLDISCGVPQRSILGPRLFNIDI